MTVFCEVENPTMNVLSIEDHLDTIRGPLDTLAFDGCAVEWSDSIDEAERLLRVRPYDFLILDQRISLPGGIVDYDAGSNLATKLKGGSLGQINAAIPFVFVTGSHEWVDEREMLRLAGFRGVLVKASDVKTKLRAYCAEVLRVSDPDSYKDRVLVRVIRADRDAIEVIVPSWRLEEEICVAAHFLPAELGSTDRLVGARLFARMNLSVESADEAELTNWELAPRLEDEDELT